MKGRYLVDTPSFVDRQLLKIGSAVHIDRVDTAPQQIYVSVDKFSFKMFSCILKCLFLISHQMRTCRSLL